MAASVLGHIEWGLKRGVEGHRTYSVRWLIQTTSGADGPGVVLSATGLPLPGSSWALGNDSDPWAFCTPEITIRPLITKERGYYWTAEQSFTTKPMSRCQTSSIEDPLAEPDRISGSFVKYTKETTKNRNNQIMTTSSHELLRGSLMEFDANKPTVSIEKSLPTLPLALFAPLVDTVNDSPMWGLGARMVKLSNVSWRRLLFGTCNYYYTVAYEFDIDYTTFDRKGIDEGTRVLADGGDPNNPNHFVQYKDANGENTRVLLNGAGSPLEDISSPYEIPIEHYRESDLFLLGIPASL